MADEIKATENQEPKLYAGKYKTVEEMESAYKQIEREASETREALDREQRLNTLLSTESRAKTEEPKPQTSDYDLSSVLGEEGSKAIKGTMEHYRSQVLNEARNLVQEAVSTVRSQEKAEKVFYKTYSELEDFRDEVDNQARLLAKELGPDRARLVPQDKLFSEVAKRTKDHLAIIKKKMVKSPLYVEGGEVKEPHIEHESSKKESTSAEDRTREYIQDEAKKMSEKKNQSLRG